MKRITAIIVCLLLASTVSGETVSVGKSTGLHGLPSSQSHVRLELKAGTSLRLLGKTKRNSYYHVQTPQGRRGWVYSRDITLFPGGSVPTAEATAPVFESGPIDRAHQLSVRASQVHTNQCGQIGDFQSCHSTFAEGCTLSARPNTYDAFLSYLKNLTPSPDSAASQIVRTLASGDDFMNLEKQSIKLGIGKQHQADFADDLADIGQGGIYATVGYLYYAVPGGVETCNCKLTDPNDRDFHIGIGFDAETAQEIKNGTIVISDNPTGTDPYKQTSVIVEMTPHYRAQYHSNWTLPILQQAAGRQVKVVGQLLIDNEHNDPSQNCAFDNRDLQHCWRASVWEIHPVTSFYVCTRDEPCASDSSDGWTELDSWRGQ